MRLQGSVALLQFPRLCQELADTCGNCEVDLHFHEGQAGRCVVEGQITAQVSVICQRSNQPMPLTLKVPIKLLVAATEPTTVLPPGFEVLQSENDEIALLDLLEDELLLAIPPYPRQAS